ncbi:MAG: sodium:calcium antiporter [Peptococcaceae bacterium]|nr:sodium:calcium antiporter [Peptococcaceae bacterium]
MVSDILWLVVSLAIILAGAEFFTNGIEWLGKKLNLGEGAVGSVLAAVGTALPETLIPLIAIFRGGEESLHVGIGAILGAPFMLVSLAMFITGLAAVIVRRKKNLRKTPLNLNTSVMSRDIGFFIIVYTVAILASFLAQPGKIVVALFLVGAYGFYVYRTIRTSVGQHDKSHQINPLYLAYRKSNPVLGIVMFQILAALGIIVLGANIFVGSVTHVAETLGMPVLWLSLIITPIATELPEKFNSVIWIIRGQDTLALGNISGAMVFQSSLIPAIGILLTPWKLETLGLLSALLALCAALWLFFSLRRSRTLWPGQLLLCGLFYIVFIVVVVTSL